MSKSANGSHFRIRVSSFQIRLSSFRIRAFVPESQFPSESALSSFRIRAVASESVASVSECVLLFSEPAVDHSALICITLSSFSIRSCNGSLRRHGESGPRCNKQLPGCSGNAAYLSTVECWHVQESADEVDSLACNLDGISGIIDAR